MHRCVYIYTYTYMCLYLCLQLYLLLYIHTCSLFEGYGYKGHTWHRLVPESLKRERMWTLWGSPGLALKQTTEPYAWLGTISSRLLNNWLLHKLYVCCGCTSWTILVCILVSSPAVYLTDIWIFLESISWCLNQLLRLFRLMAATVLAASPYRSFLDLLAASAWLHIAAPR